MSLYDAYRQTDYLDDYSFIAGTEIDLKFPIYDSNGVPILVRNTPSSSMIWLLGYYGQPNSEPILQKTATFDSETYNTFVVSLSSEDTINLGDDIYLQQMIITDSEGVKTRPAQGIIIIRKAIPET